MRLIDIKRSIELNQLFVTVSAWISRVVIAGVQFISIRYLLSGLGSENYSIYVIITSLAGWFALIDFGVGASLQNYISEKRAKEESYLNYITNALFCVLICASIAIFIAYIFKDAISGSLLSSYNNISSSDKSKVVFYASIVYIISIFSNLTIRILYADQKGYIANIVNATSSVISLILVIVIIKFNFNNKLLKCLLGFLIPNVIIFGIILMLYIKKNIKYGFLLNKNIIKVLLNRAMRFFIFSMMGLLITQVDYLILSQTSNAKTIVIYNIVSKMFNFVFSLYGAVLAAYTPVCAELFVKRDSFNIRKILSKQIKYAFLSLSIFMIIVLLFNQQITSIFSPKERIEVRNITIVLFTLYFLIRIWCDSFTTTLISINKFRSIFILSIFQACFSITFQYFLSVKFGVNGIVLGLILSYLLTGAWSLPREAKKYLVPS